MNSKCEECMHFDGYACYSEDVCFANNRFKPKERNYVNMFVDDMKEKETVDHPSHYNKGIEAIEYIESHDFNFNLGNAIKYITRCEHKGNKVEDLKKSLWYLERELAKEK